MIKAGAYIVLYDWISVQISTLNRKKGDVPILIHPLWEISSAEPFNS